MALAFGTTFAIDSPTVAIIAFTIVGLGASPIFPVAFSIGGRLPNMASGTAVGAVSMVSRAGFLLAPLAVGVTASTFSFGLAFTLIALAGVVVAGLTAALSSKLA